MTTMDEDYVCTCGHTADQHNDPLGYCEARACTCLGYRNRLDDFGDEDDEKPEPLNFDEDADR